MATRKQDWKIEIRIKNRTLKLSPKEVAALRRQLSAIAARLPKVDWRVRPLPWMQVLPRKPAARSTRR